ncbi:MAG TPA: hypothetical protein VF719_01085 [Abditibacteriaceae bacterium]
MQKVFKVHVMSATNERDVAMHIAKTDFKKALVFARKVSQPWFCCQALAGVARYAPDEHVAKTIKESIAAAFMAPDFYQRVAVTAWPLRALIERNQEHKVLQLLPEILELSVKIENPINRTDALFLLWQAVFPHHGHETILGLLVKSCSAHWKADYILRQIIVILASVDMTAAQELAASMPEGKYKRQAEKRLTEGATEQARQFYF